MGFRGGEGTERDGTSWAGVLLRTQFPLAGCACFGFVSGPFVALGPGIQALAVQAQKAPLPMSQMPVPVTSGSFTWGEPPRPVN